MAKQLNVEMSFTADTSKAKQQIEQLQQALQKLSSGSSIQNKGLAITKDIQEGMKAASQLQVILEKAINTNTGKLDLTKFTQSLNASKTNLNQLRINLEKLGPQGSQAFLQVARSISNANTPLLSVNKRLSTLFTTLKNTAKWQISSSLLHGFMGAVSTAYRYTQDLNESLNNIRIRTGQSTEEMAKFAEQANQAAKSLSTTTLDYTKAALIYYQQGLDDEQVKARTDVTVKMANVTRDSAETVSQQLTAVWNNFDKGGEKLEYIADVMNALGAATASSTSEIATGLQKFAAAADAAGLSYEYAASALATITATTRQSADTVGTGLRTVLARIESLNLGETLEDGVGLTKYTKALEAIGVQVLDNNGQLKAADEILDAMAEKWQGLTDAQKMATAETVGGIRQYTTIMALMENWDFMQQNVGIAKGSSGTLQKQAEIYAESWEAAQKRVKAAAQAIYSDLIDDKFFITILNGAEKILAFIDDLIRSLGGLPGLLSTISTIVFKLLGPQIASGLTTVATTLKSLTPSGQAQIQAQKDQAWQEAQAAATNLVSSGQGNYAKELSATMQQEASIQRNLVDNAEKMSQLEKEAYQNQLDGLRIMQERNMEEAKYIDQLDQEIAKEVNGSRGKQDVANKYAAYGALEELKSSTFNEDGELNSQIQTVEQLQQKLETIQSVFDKFHINSEVIEQIDLIKEKISSLDKTQDFRGLDDLKEDLFEVAEILDIDVIQAYSEASDAQDKFIKASKGSETAAKSVAVIAEKAEMSGQAFTVLQGKTQSTKKYVEDLNNSINNSSGNIQNWATNLVNVASGISSISMGVNSFVGVINTFEKALEEGNLSFSQMLSMFTSLSMSITMIVPAFSKLSKIGDLFTSIGTSIGKATTAMVVNNMAAKTTASSIDILSGAINQNSGANIENVLTKELGVDADTAQAISLALVDAAKKSENELTEEQIRNIIAETLAKEGNVVTTQRLTAAIWAKVAAQMAEHWYLLVIIAAIAALIAIMAISIAKYNELSKAEQEAADTAKATADAYNKTKTAFEELKSTIEDYKDAKDALSDLRQGTQEWTDTINSANEKANELLNTYSELRQYAHFNANTGLMEFLDASGNEIDLDKFVEQQNAKVNSAYTTKVMADTAHVRAESALTTENFVRGYNYESQESKNIALYSEDNIENILNQLADNFINNGGNLANAKAGLSEENKAVLEMLQYTDQALYELCNTLNNNSNLIDANTKQLAYSLIEETKADNKVKDADLLNTVVANRLQEQTAQELQNLKNAGGVSQSMRESYAEAQGYNVNHIETKKGKNTFYDMQGNTMADSITDDLILQWQASQNAQQVIKNNIEDTTNQVNSITDKIAAESGGDYEASRAVAEFLTGARDDFNDLSQDTVETLKTKLYGSLSVKDLEALGIKGGTAFIQSYKDAIDKYNPYDALDKAVGGYTTLQGDKIPGGFEEFTVSNRGGFSRDDLHNWYDSLSEEDKTFAVRLNFDRAQSSEDLYNALSELREQAASEKIAAELDLDEDSLQFADDMAEAFNEANAEIAANEGMLVNDSEAVSDAAVRFTKLNEAVEDLYDNFDDYEKILIDVQSAQSKMDKALVLADKDAANFRKSLAKLVDTSEDFIDTNFIDAIDPDDLEKAAMGDEKAIGRIRDAFIDAQAAAADLADDPSLGDFKNQLAEMADGAVIDIDNFPFLQKLIESKLAAGATAPEIEALLSGMGIDCDVTPFTEAMNDVINASNTAATIAGEAGDAIVGSMSFDATSNEVTVDSTDTQEDTAFEEQGSMELLRAPTIVPEGTGSIPVTYEAQVPIFSKTVIPQKESTQNKKQQTINAVKLSNMHKSAGGNVSASHKNTSSPRSGGKGGGGGGGGGSAPKAAKTGQAKPKKVERYKEITDTIDDLTKALEKTNTVSDRLWGKDRLSSMQKANDILKKQADAYKEKARQAENFLKIDKQALQNTLNSSWKFDLEGGGQGSESMKQLFKDYGMNLEEFQFDEDGDIINYTDVMTKLYSIYNYRQQKWANAANWANADEQSQYEAYWVKPLEEQIGLIEDAIKQYEETKGVWEDNLEAAEEAKRAWQDNNFEQLEYKLELKIEVDERELKKLEYYIEKMQDDFYLRAENLVNYIGKVEVAENELKNYAGTIEELNEKYRKGENSQDVYYEELKKIQEEENEQ